MSSVGMEVYKYLESNFRIYRQLRDESMVQFEVVLRIENEIRECKEDCASLQRQKKELIHELSERAPLDAEELKAEITLLKSQLLEGKEAIVQLQARLNAARSRWRELSEKADRAKRHYEYEKSRYPAALYAFERMR